MKRTLLSFILAIGMTANIWADTVIEGIKYALNDDFTATVTGLDAPSFTGTITIPETIKFYGNTYQVAQIGERAFYQYKFKVVNLPNSLTSIGEWAFYGCTGLREINVDEGNTVYSSIDGILFNKSQTELILYPGGKGASYSIPNFVTSIGVDAFSGCTGLTSVTIPNSVENIKNGAFSGCTNLTSVTINSNAIMSKVYSSSFNMSTIFGNQVKTYIIGNFVTNIGANAFSGCTALTSVTIPNSVENIENGAFSGCTSLTSVTINSNAIMSKSYSSSSNLSTIFGDQVQTLIIGDSVTSIGGLYYCTSLIAINVDKNNTNYSSIDGVLFNKSQTELIRYPRRKQGVYTVPNSVENIKNGAFSGCTGWISVTIGNSMTRIGENAFDGCSGLTSVTIPNSVTSIGNWAFSGCTALDSLTIPNSVTSIGAGAFQGCTDLDSVTIPNSVTSIEHRAFEKCTRLKDIYCHIGEPLNISDRVLVFFKVPTNTCTLHVPLGCKEKYKAAIVWNDFLNIVEDLPTQSFTIGNLEYTKRGATVIVGKGGTLTGEVVIPESVEYEGKQYPVTRIGVDAFSGCIGLTSITIPNSVTSIGENAFRDCTGLTSVTIPNSVENIENGAFSGCTGLTSVTIPNSVTSIGANAFSGCTALTSVTINSNAIMSKTYSSSSNLSTIFGKQVQTYIIGDSVTSIGFDAFRNSTGLTAINVDGNNINYSSIDGVLFNKSQTELIRYPEGKQGAYTIPNSVASIEGNAFIGCIGLTSVTIPNSVTSIGSLAFYGCTGLTSVTIPNSVTSIGESAFGGCSGLTSVTIGNSVTSIGENTFYNCTGLTSVYIPNSVTSIGRQAFYYCSGLTSVTIPNYVTSIGYGAFNGCSSLTSITIPNSVTSIGEFAFYKCNGLTDIYCPIEEPLAITIYVFTKVTTSTCTLHVPIGSKEKYEVAEMWEDFLNIVEDLPAQSFTIGNLKYTMTSESTVTVRVSEGKTLTGELVIPESVEYEGKQYSVTSIGKYAFSDCSGLTSVIIPNSVTSIGSQAFDGCSGLTSVTIPNSVTSIGNWAFNRCSGLTSVTIGNSVTSIGSQAFFGCSGLTDIYCHIEEPLTIDSYVFNNVPKNTCTLHVPIGSKVKYQAADVWKEFLNIVEDLPTGIVSIDNSQSTIDNDVWFTLNGVRLNGKPTIPGIYIVNGLKVVIK